MDKIDAKSISAWMDACDEERVENGKLTARLKALTQYLRDRGLISVRKMAKIMDCKIDDITLGI